MEEKQLWRVWLSLLDEVFLIRKTKAKTCLLKLFVSLWLSVGEENKNMQCAMQVFVSSGPTDKILQGLLATGSCWWPGSLTYFDLDNRWID